MKRIKKGCSIAYLLIVLLLPSLTLASAQHPQTGDWVITEPTTIIDETIILTGNLIVLSSLTLNNTILKLNCSYNGEFGIFITSGGSLKVINNSIITALNKDEEHKYIFSAYGEHFELRDSELSYCELFIVQTANATISNSQLINNNYGTYIFNTGQVQVTGNIITSSGSMISNVISNSGFESGSGWIPSASAGGVARVQDNSQKHSGSYSGLTDTRSLPADHMGYAKLTQNLNPTPISQILNQENSLEVWIRNGGKALMGYRAVEIQVWSAEGRVLHYRWRLDGSTLPADTAIHKYIDMGTSLPLGTWTLVQRNLYVDWVNLKGMPSTDKMDKIILYNEGGYFFMDIIDVEIDDTMKRDGRIYMSYGQLINWDDVQLRCSENIYTSGIVLASVQNSLIQSNTITNYQNGIYLYSSSGNNIKDNSLKENTNGIYLFDSHNNSVEGNTASKNDYAGIVTNTSDGNTIKNNELKMQFLGMFILASNGNTLQENMVSDNRHGIYVEGSNYNVIHSNTVQSNINGITLTGFSNYNRIEMSIIESNDIGILIQASEGNVLTSNDVTGNRHGVYLFGSSKNNLIQNAVVNNSGDGFVITSSSNMNILTDNDLINNDKGVFIISSQDNTLSQNDIENNNYGVWIHNSKNNTVSQNSIILNLNYGVAFIESDQNTLSNNQISRSGTINLYVESSRGNIMTGNTVKNSQYGIFQFKSSQNSIQENVINEHKNGILLTDNSDRHDISNNQLDGNNIAIFIKCSNRSTVTENHLQNNEYGIYLYEAPNNIIQRNILNNNEDTGIAVTKWSDRTSVVNNKISGHKYGMFLYKSEDLTVNGNIFSNNQEDIHVPPNLVQNNGFESSTEWEASATHYGKARIQDDSYKRTGGYSGMTDSRPSIAEVHPSWNGLIIVTAKLTQNLEDTPVSRIIDKPDSIELWLMNLGYAKDGGKTVEVQVWSVEGRVLHYRWRLDGSSLPGDTANHKYVDMGTSLPKNEWIRLERNFYADWVSLKGMPSTDKIDKIILYNEGGFDFKDIRMMIKGEKFGDELDIDTILNGLDIEFIPKFYGQKVNWDSIYLDWT